MKMASEDRNRKAGFTWGEIVGIVVTFGAGIVGAIFTSAGLRILSVLIGVAMALIIGVYARIEKMDLHMASEVGRIEREMVPIANQLATLPEVQSDLREIVAEVAEAKTRRSDFIYQQLLNRIRGNRNEIAAIVRGEFMCRTPSEETALLEDALRTTRDHVQAIAGLGIAAWSKPSWSTYFAAYMKHARETKVQHTRIFILEREDLEDDHMKELLEHHRNAGIDTIAVNRQQLDAKLCQPVVLFDGDLLMRHWDRQKGNDAVEVVFTDDEDEIARAKSTVSQLLELIKQYPEQYVLWPVAA